MNNLNDQNLNEQDSIYDFDNSVWVNRKIALDRLMDNPDFKLLIVEGYLRDHAADQVSLLANEHIKRQGHRPDIIETLVGISHLRDFFVTVENMVAQLTEEADYDGEE